MSPMSIDFIDGFDEYGVIGNISKKWDATNLSYSSLESGRIAAPSVNVFSKSLKLVFTESCSKNFSNSQSMYTGFALKLSSLGGSPTPFLEFKNSGADICGLAVKPNGAILLYDGGSVANDLAESAGTIISGNTWNYVECFLNVFTSKIKVFVNGSSVIDVTAGRLITENYVTTLELIGNFGIDTYFDDLQASTSSVSLTAPSYCGDARVMTFTPTGDITRNEFSGAPAGDHYKAVDEATPDDSSTVLSSSTSGSVEWFQFDFNQLPANVFIQAVGWNVYAKKSSADPTAKFVAKNRNLFDATESLEFDLIPELLTADYKYHYAIQDLSGSVSRSTIVAGFTGVADDSA
jgi:hypothetical protein